ncbi:Lysophospholipase-like 1 [Nesidiocoris tenuis]|uniref:palmitoyl-protein hydrolase n=1 Tax=Nesidiocoris tenuis TaxID=355587 RepID=A0ABN7AWJ8_9HEMI|nr:Lysophospholipase-like 1 [Nesidiocoris tenuis]
MANFDFEDIAIIEQTGYKPTAALIFLHGEGQTGQEICNIFKDYFGTKSGHSYFKLIFPTAPVRTLTSRNPKLHDQRYWFDVVPTGQSSVDVSCNLKDAEDVSSALDRLIEKTSISGVPRDRIVIGGISQGGMVSLYAAYARGIRIGGVVSIASPFLFHKQTTLLDGKKPPLLSIYGEKDVSISSEEMNTTWTMFKQKQLPATIKKLRQQGHNMHTDYAKVIFEWLQSEFPPLEWF